jgi:hypothetical protein
MRNATYFVAVITKAADTHKFSTQQTIQRQWLTVRQESQEWWS